MEHYELTDREKIILRNVIHQFILTANPVGSRYISKKYNLNLSAATIRNIMADLEETGFLNHPHTSAGRIPTDKGYRFYVDSLMEPPLLDETYKKMIEDQFDTEDKETDEVLKVTSMLLSSLTNQIACVGYPKLDNSVLEKIKLVELSSTRILVVVTIKSGLLKTITLEFNAEIDEKSLREVERLLNERLSGLKLKEIRETFGERMKEHSEEFQPIIRVFLDSIDKIFTNNKSENKAVIFGARNIFEQPEFEDQKNFRSVIELIEDKEVIVHIMEQSMNENKDLVVAIGEENKENWMNNYSLISKSYELGDATGSLGIIGPKRMQYSKSIAAVVYIAELLTKELKVKE